MPAAEAQSWFVIMAGGRGTRFWPLSRRHRPKQVLPLAGEQSLLRQTVARLLPMVPAERILVVTGPDMEAAVRAELDQLPAANVLVEPSGRNTAPCIGWAAVEIQRRAGPQARVAVLPSDQVIERPDELRAALELALRVAGSTDSIVTLGIRPSRPETGFGYLELGEEVDRQGDLRVRRVVRFHEKPDLERARRWSQGGQHLWNAGMFAFTVGTMRAAFAQHLPRSAAALDLLLASPERLPELWTELEATSIDYGIMERASSTLTVPCDPGWSDVGAWPAVGELLPELPGGRGRAGRCVAVQSAGNTVLVPDKLVALVGVQDLVVVDTADALLVMDLAHAQELRQVLAELDALGLTALT